MTTDVLLVEIPSQPGGFRKICEKLAAEHLNIDYAYCSFNAGGKQKGGVLAVIKVNDLSKAQRLLSENGTARKKMPFRRPVLAGDRNRKSTKDTENTQNRQSRFGGHTVPGGIATGDVGVAVVLPPPNLRRCPGGFRVKLPP